LKLAGARRGKLINVYRSLLNSPGLAESWFQHINAVRWGTSLDGRLREIVIIRIGYLAKAAYVIRQHVPKLAVADGVSIEECEALRDWQASNLFDARERAVLAFADAVTQDATASDEAFAALVPHFDAKGLVDLTVLIATYNMHARVVNALALDLETD
jgi:alkylhydroperoxidase family enzyme